MNFNTTKHKIIINAILILLSVKLLLDISIFYWNSDFVVLFKYFLVATWSLILLFNIRSIPILKHSKLASKLDLLTPERVFNLIFNVHVFILIGLLCLSGILSYELYQFQSKYSVGLFGLFVVWYLGFKSFFKSA